MAYPPVFKFNPTLHHYVRLHTHWLFYKKMWNSFIIAIGTTGISILVGSFAAYGLSRFKFWGSGFLSTWILSNRFLPTVAILLPLFLFFRSTNLIDTHLGLILANLLPNVPFSVWLLRSFFAEIPRELDEAARVDGCNSFAILWRIVFPIARPAIAVTALFNFLFTWNEFFIPLALSRTKAMPVTVAFAAFRQHIRMDWGGMAAASVVCFLPLFAVTLLFQQHIVRGMTLGAVKE